MKRIEKAEVDELTPEEVEELARKIAHKMGVTPNHTEWADVVQEGCLGYYETRSRYRPDMGSQMLTWAWWRMSGRMRDYFRGRSMYSRYEYERSRPPRILVSLDDALDLPDTDLGPESVVEFVDAVQAVERIIAALSQVKQDVIRQTYLDDECKLIDIGKALGLSESRICQIRREALRELRSKMG